MKKVVGITGGLATGKSTVTDLFVEKGAVRIDADKIGHILLEEDESIKQSVLRAYGTDILSGGHIDRKKLAKKVFASKEELDKLCAILHPSIIENIKKKIEDAGSVVVAVDAPLLFEADLVGIVDVVVVVAAGHDAQIKRAVGRGMTPDEAEAVIASQMPLSEKIKSADHVIDNSEDLSKIKEGVERIWQNL